MDLWRQVIVAFAARLTGDFDRLEIWLFWDYDTDLKRIARGFNVTVVAGRQVLEPLVNRWRQLAECRFLLPDADWAVDLLQTLLTSVRRRLRHNGSLMFLETLLDMMAGFVGLRLVLLVAFLPMPRRHPDLRQEFGALAHRHALMLEQVL